MAKRLALLGVGLFYVGIALFVVEWVDQTSVVVPFLTLSGLSIIALAVIVQGNH
ncbi:hypothetical protein [Halobacillus sp. Marseille-P3879]|uniref:hypothetical protein n=1 Tax=Halobacillus TaxID=45667 RepID=UPI001357E1C4|nr:hypothetical protein [Halobacillus sp. Marseille-P3879]